jgi:hypothetical protein
MTQASHSTRAKLTIDSELDQLETPNSAGFEHFFALAPDIK